MIARDTIALITLAPLLAIQTLFVLTKVQRLPEPDGARRGETGTGLPLRMLILGDSSAAGIGVAHQSEALAHPMATHMSADFRVHWHLCARGGATLGDALTLLEPVHGQSYDIAYVVFGVNDVKNMRSERAWRRDARTVIHQLRDSHNVRDIVMAALPPVSEFPLLPNPLRHLLAMRSRRFDEALAQICATEGATHLTLDVPIVEDGIASDGFHPGKKVYAFWAKAAAQDLMRLTKASARR